MIIVMIIVISNTSLIWIVNMVILGVIHLIATQIPNMSTPT